MYMLSRMLITTSRVKPSMFSARCVKENQLFLLLFFPYCDSWRRPFIIHLIIIDKSSSEPIYLSRSRSRLGMVLNLYVFANLNSIQYLNIILLWSSNRLKSKYRFAFKREKRRYKFYFIEIGSKQISRLMKTHEIRYIFLNRLRKVWSQRFPATSYVIHGELGEFCILACDARSPKGSV